MGCGTGRTGGGEDYETGAERPAKNWGPMTVDAATIAEFAEAALDGRSKWKLRNNIRVFRSFAVNLTDIMDVQNL